MFLTTWLRLWHVGHDRMGLRVHIESQRCAVHVKLRGKKPLSSNIDKSLVAPSNSETGSSGQVLLQTHTVKVK